MSRLEVQFVGCGDAFGSGGRFQTCILLRLGSEQVAIDLGASSLVAMKQQGVDPGRVGTVLLSHLHGDHFGGLPYLVLDGQFGRRSRPLRIAGPPGTRQRVEATMEALFPGSSRSARRFEVEYHEMREREPLQLGDLQVTPFPVDHASGAPPYALRASWAGCVVTYSGDTAWTESLVEAARGADLFICEAYFFERKIRYHLDYRTLCEHRQRLECGRLVLTHMSADMLARLDEVDAECAHDGKIIAL